LQVDADVERIDAAEDDAEVAAALDDVRVYETARCDAVAERDCLLVRLEASDHRLEPADELRAAGLLTLCVARTTRCADRRNGDAQKPDQPGQAKETSDPHGGRCSRRLRRATQS